MDTLSSMNKALAYIEEHLTEDMDYKTANKKNVPLLGDTYFQSRILNTRTT